jgi:hypothetical protein
MGISFRSAGEQALAQVVAGATKPAKRKRSGNTRPRPLLFALDQPGVRVRVGHWLALLDCSSCTFYALKKQGQVPAADGHDPRPYWHGQTVQAYMVARALQGGGQ